MKRPAFLMLHAARDRSAVGPVCEPIESRLCFSVVQPIVRAIVATPADDGEIDAPLAKPVITAPVGLAVAAGARFRYAVLATANPLPSIHLISGPTGMTIKHGVLYWSPTTADMGAHSITVSAKNSLGRSRLTFTLTVTTDQTAPTAPEVSVGTVTATTVPLTWTASTDNLAVAGYRVYSYTPAIYRGHSGRDGGITLVSPAKLTLIADHLTGTAYTVTGLLSGSTTKYVVGAYDAAGNQADSNIVTATTP